MEVGTAGLAPFQGVLFVLPKSKEREVNQLLDFSFTGIKAECGVLLLINN